MDPKPFQIRHRMLLSRPYVLLQVLVGFAFAELLHHFNAL